MRREAVVAMASVILVLCLCLVIIVLTIDKSEEPVIIHEGATVKTTTAEEPITVTVEELTKETVKAPVPRYDSPLDEDMEIFIESVAREFGLEYELVMAVIAIESQYLADKVGDDGNSIGLMQIQPRYWQGLADELGASIYAPKGNIVVGCAILSKLASMYDGDLKKVLKAYNSGNPNYNDETYYNKIINKYKEIKANE